MPRPQEVAAAKRDPRLLRAFRDRQDDGVWRTRGVCQSVDPETFFPAPSEPADAAIALCRTCEVQGACLAWALDVGDCHGVWGGTTPRERRAMLVAWRTAGEGTGVASPVDPPMPVVAAFAAAPPSGTAPAATGTPPAIGATATHALVAGQPAPVGGRRLGLVPPQRDPGPLERRQRTDDDLVERVAS
jgi:hypothetical protein